MALQFLSPGTRSARRSFAMVILTLALAGAGCWPFGGPRRTNTPAPIEAPPVKRPAEAQARDSNDNDHATKKADPLPPPPNIAPAPESPLTPPDLSAGEPIPEPPPPRTPSKPQRSASTLPSQSAEETPNQPTTVPPPETRQTVPRLTRFLSEEERWEYNRELDALLLKVNQTVAVLHQRSLSGEQMTMLDRVRTFARQAAEARDSDLVTSLGLAKRAALLSEELERSTR